MLNLFSQIDKKLSHLTCTVPYGTMHHRDFALCHLGEGLDQLAVDNSVVAPDDITDRQSEVLSAVLQLMVEEGDGFSMAKVCRRASCSKETLYNWFGDRDGLLTATVQWQASRVVMPEFNQAALSKDTFRDGLAEFAKNWLSVVTGDISIALNRAAISHAGSGKTNLGKIVLQNGPAAMSKRLEPIFKMGKDAKLMFYRGHDDAFKVFFGLVIGDIQTKVLLGDLKRPSTKEISKLAVIAADQFLLLHEVKQ